MFFALIAAGLLLIGAFLTVVVFLACTVSGLFSLFFTVAVVSAIVLLFRENDESKT